MSAVPEFVETLAAEPIARCQPVDCRQSPRRKGAGAVNSSAAVPASTFSERELQDVTLELAHVLGWHLAHFRPARTEKGWRTAVSADGAGFPDIVAVRRERLLVAELKSARGKLAPEQSAWLELLADAGIETHVWRPADWVSGTIEAVLR